MCCHVAHISRCILYVPSWRALNVMCVTDLPREDSGPPGDSLSASGVGHCWSWPVAHVAPPSERRTAREHRQTPKPMAHLWHAVPSLLALDAPGG